MRESGFRRLAFATLFALSAGLIVALANPAPRIKADLRADTHGLVLSLEYVPHLIEGRGTSARL